MIRIRYNEAEVLFFGDFFVRDANRDKSAALINSYKDWLKLNNIEYRYEYPFTIIVDEKYAEDILAFKLKFGL